MKQLVRTGRAITAVLLLILLAANLAFFFIMPVKAAPLDTYHSGWKLVRETADEDGGDFLTTYNLPIQGNFANKNTTSWLTANGGAYKIPKVVRIGVGTDGYSEGGVWMFALCAKNYDVGADNTIDNTFSFNIVGWSIDNGMLQTIVEGDCILGTQAVIEYPIDSSGDLGTDAVGALVDMTAVTYTYGGGSTETFAKTNIGLNVVAGMMAYVTGTNITDGYYAITNVGSNDIITMSGIASSGDNTDSTVQINPAFWVDTINLDETTKWPSVGRYNNADNEVCFILVDTAGLEWIQFVIYGATPAATGEAGDVTVYGRPY